MALSSERSDGLDTLRLIAIIAVLFDHYVGLEEFKPGTLSVRFFLFLSGFLITATLHKYSLPEKQDNKAFLKAFYARRALRIWPLYYLLIIGALLIQWISVKQFFVHAAFLTNIAQAWHNDWNYPWFFSHLWTICVQEQFYLTWPVLFLCLRRHWVFLATMIGVAMLFRAGMSLAGYSETAAISVIPFASADALAIGALVALYHERLNSSIARPGLCIAVFFVLCLAWTASGDDIIQDAVLPTLWLVPISILALGVYHDRFGRIAAILEWSPLVLLGRISLGIYLLHMPLWHAVFVWGPSELVSLVAKPSITTFAIMTLATNIVAILLWVSFEKPVQSFRKFMPYPRQRQVRDPLGQTSPSI